MSADTSLSTIINSDVKKALTEYCKRQGLKVRYVVEQSIIEKLEDELDREAYRKRKNEETFSLESVLKDLKLD